MDVFIKTHYVLIIILGTGTVLSFLWVYLFNREKANLKWWQSLIAVISATIIGVLALRFFALLESGFDNQKAGEMSFFGGIFVLPLFAFVFAKIKKIPMSLILDIFTVVLVILSFGRINCLISGCCYGKYIGTSDIRYPTREIELVFDGVFLVIAIFLNLKNKLQGRVYYLYLMSYGTLRFVIEFMRHSEVDSVFHIGHAWAILSILIGTGLFIYFTIKEKQQLENNTKKGRN